MGSNLISVTVFEIFRVKVLNLTFWPWSGSKVHRKGRWPAIYLGLPPCKISARSRKCSTSYALPNCFTFWPWRLTPGPKFTNDDVCEDEQDISHRSGCAVFNHRGKIETTQVPSCPQSTRKVTQRLSSRIPWSTVSNVAKTSKALWRQFQRGQQHLEDPKECGWSRFQQNTLATSPKARLSCR